ncbi:RNA polymerase sigma-70 factor, ECF subfamily [Neorhodopirellula lusitana]|uniref:RNA polymerase sigma-70 factor, ECF subfamily n=1 Tax=Neorhodopirellula lusitana TaxID=445327 RepID=A0ABY1Q2P5_9BACT|nr:RNA polymerase sigma factor [Neorhodopirellula lusitana]SMP57391.1 RNA polymerase sigma-70 factor, ECF subfamily [Neorhodopirellula lusitana]
MTSSPPETRASLILRLQDPADIAAWNEFAEIYAPVIYRSARRLGLQAADADDVVQEVLSAVARSVSGWLDREERGAFRAWLFRIARNLSIDFLTRRKHRPWAAGGDEAARHLNEVEADSDISSHIDAEVQREIFVRASQSVRACVSDTTWKAFHRTAVLGESIERVAAELSISAGSIYIARSRVMKRLQNEVTIIQKRCNDEM